MKQSNHIFQGLRRDNHQIKQDSKFLWNAHNIRLTNREDSTLLSITNERGTKYTGLSFNGEYVGHYVLGKYLVVFTSKIDGSDNYIYRVEETPNGYKTIILFHNKDKWKYSWTPEYPIEAIGIYETELIQKIYWVDGINQPRMINIAKPELKLPEYCIIDGVNLSGTSYRNGQNTFYPPEIDNEGRNIDQILEELIPNGLYNTNSFDFVRDLSLKEVVNVTKSYGSGVFSPGIIQYAISYYNKYEQESNIAYTTPLYYVSPKDRAGSPEESISCYFTIDIDFPDNNFEYIRIYSIHRTSIDAVPTVKVLEDLSITNSNTISYTDTGNTGSIIDPSQLLYIGGESIIAGCIEHKDNTLFLGNITQNNIEHWEDIKQLIIDSFVTEGKPNLSYKDINAKDPNITTVGVFYDYTPNLSDSYTGRFKFGEIYRYGIQVQFSNGKWSDPIHIYDGELTSDFPWNTGLYRTIGYLRAKSSIDNSLQNKLLNLGVKSLRTCVVFPRSSERNIICQGVLCPTVFNVNGRRSGYPYAMSSWFFRPGASYNDNNTNINKGASIQFRHNYALFAGGDRGAEIQNMLKGADTLNHIHNAVDNYESHFFVDENIITFHSPDVEFDTDIQNMDFSNVKLKVVGITELKSIAGDIDIQTSTPVIDPTSEGFIHNILGYTLEGNNNINGGLISTTSYVDASVKLDNSKHVKGIKNNWLIYPWHRSGSLNNDENRGEDGTRSSVLSKKVISNIKFFKNNKSINNPITYNIGTPSVFYSNELSLNKIDTSYLGQDITYLGNVDTLNTGEEYPIYRGKLDVLSPIAGTDYILKSTDPIRIKYKSSPHIVFSLHKTDESSYDSSVIELLPKWSGLPEDSKQDGTPFTPPLWQESFTPDNTIYDGTLRLYQKSGIPDRLDPSAENQYIIVNNTLMKSFKKSDDTYIWIVNNEGIPEDPVVLRIEAGSFYCIPYNYNLPGTEISDYVFSNVYSSKYNGGTRYYRIYTDASRHVYKIEPVGTNNTGTIPSKSNNSAITLDNTNFILSQKEFEINDISSTDALSPYLLIGELVREFVPNKFGGDSEEAKKQNLWIPAGKPYRIVQEDGIGEGDIILPFEYGDTWYSRYDCLKTYPFTSEDENQIVEIGSFLCETRFNVDGRYDKNRGQVSNLTMNPQNFNLMNEVYSQKDNFFNYRIFDSDYYKQTIFGNQVTWSKEKHVAEVTDTWANITLANTLDLNGDKGGISALKSWNELLLCFQDKSLSKINFNSRVQIPTSDGVPIEISNGYKVDGSLTISDSIGCRNKWSIVCTSLGVYFIDTNTHNIYLFNGNLQNLSINNGVSWWTRNNRTNNLWKPISYESGLNGIRSFVDTIYGDVYFTPGSVSSAEQPDAFCYSEILGNFVSTMSYGGTQAMFNYGDKFYSLKGMDGNLNLYINNEGDYNYFFNEYKGWDISFISNDNPIITKIFDTIELRADAFAGIEDTPPLNSCPVNFINVSNEYQDSGIVPIDNRIMRKKFRIWRGLLPRHNNTRQRIRNPWAMITLGWKPNPTLNSENNSERTIIHDISVKYTL